MSKATTVISINVGYGMVMHSLIQYIRRYADFVSVFCFQETDQSTRLALDTILLEHFHGYYSTKINGNSGFYLSTYVRKDIKVIGIEEPLADFSHTGGALTCTIFDYESDRPMFITNVHGNSQPGDKLDTAERLLQSKIIIASLAGKEGAHIIISDFNLLPDTHSVQLFVDQGYANLISDFNITTTRNEIAWEKYPDTKQLYADYVFVKRVEASRYSFKVDPDIVSDHLPLVMTIAPLSHVATPSERSLSDIVPHV